MRWSRALAVALLVAVGTAGCASEPRERSRFVPASSVSVTRGAEPLRVLLMGDSLMAGLVASDSESTFREIITEALAPDEAIDSALTGGTTGAVWRKFGVPADLDLAIIELGTNDLYTKNPLSTFRATYERLLSTIKAQSPGVAIICAGVWQGTWLPVNDRYDKVIRDSCERAGGVFVSLRSLYRRDDTISRDAVPFDFHPNDVGHRAIAGALLARVFVD